MTKKIIKTIVVGVIIGLITNHYSFSQVDVNSGGSSGNGSGGTIEFSIGQISYSTNSNSSGTITEGIQQPFEIILITSFLEAPKIELYCSVFPNPASDYLTLKVDDYGKRSLSYKLFDFTGQLLQEKSVIINEIIIEMNKYPAGIYFLKVEENQKELKTFKIIKN